MTSHCFDTLSIGVLSKGKQHSCRRCVAYRGKMQICQYQGYHKKKMSQDQWSYALIHHHHHLVITMSKLALNRSYLAMLGFLWYHQVLERVMAIYDLIMPYILSMTSQINTHGWTMYHVP